MKKVLCLFMVVVMVFSVSSFAFAAEKKTPVVVVSGMGGAIYEQKSDGTREEVYPPKTADVISACAELLPSLVKAMIKDDYSLINGKMTKLEGLFSDYACNPDGTLKDNIVADVYPKNAANYAEFNDDGEKSEWDIVRSAADAVGTENAYFFNYVWSESPLKIAKDLDAYIQNVKKETGSSKVSVIACSMGGTITMSYLKLYGFEDIENVVLTSTAFLGTEIAGQLFTKNIEIKLDAILEYFGGFVSNEAVETVSQMIVKIAKNYGFDLFARGDAFLKNFIDSAVDAVFAEVFYNSFISMPGIWALVPESLYTQAKETVFADGKYPEFISDSDYYIENVQAKAPEIIADARKAGVNFYITATYLCSSIPLYKNRQGYTDNLIDLRYASGGATVADYGEFVSENITAGINCADKSHNHISDDKIVNASTCILPEQTWFLRNIGHMGYKYGTDSCALLVYLVTSKNEVSVNSNPAFPQFSFFDKESGKLVSLTSEDKPLSQLKVTDLFVKLINSLIAFIKGIFAK